MTAQSFIHGALSALWILGLYGAAPVLKKTRAYEVVDRLGDAIILGVLIPLGLATVNLLYPFTCWLALVICVVVATLRSFRVGSAAATNAPSARSAPLLLVAVLAGIAWPQLIRPLLDGDSASYHLPIAAAWIHAHSIWTTDATYWWYPPASEAFASALLETGGPYAVGWSGFAVLLLLGFRLRRWASQEAAVPQWLADALAAAVVTVGPIAIQGGTMQNDVWLAAFVIETLWSMKISRNDDALRSIIVLSLIKPYGFVLALIVAAAARARLVVWVCAAAPIALWAAHDAILWNAATVPALIGSTSNQFQTSILSHGIPAIGLFARVMLGWSPFGFVAFCTAAAGAVLARRRDLTLGLVAFASAALFLVMPLAYADYHAQLATGGSLRFCSPAIALGALLLCRYIIRAPVASAALLWASAIFGLIQIAILYSTDLASTSAFAVIVGAVLLVALSNKWQRSWPALMGFGAAVVLAYALADKDPSAYFAGGWQVYGRTTDVYAWIARNRPSAVAGLGLRLGAVNQLSPDTRTVHLTDVSACATARRNGLLLIAIAQDDRSRRFNADRLNAARHCGSVLFDDGIAVVVGPR
jgi:hypothetical protein